MQFIQYVLFNNERIDFDVKSRPIIGQKRANPHFSGIGEKEVEKQFISKMKSEGFKENKCTALDWFRQVFPETNIKHEKLRGLAEFFAYKFGERLGREIYRRRACLMYWFQEKLEEISNLLYTNTMFVSCENRLYMVTPPIQHNPHNQPQIAQLPAPKIEDQFTVFNSFESYDDVSIELNDVNDDPFVIDDGLFGL